MTEQDRKPTPECRELMSDELNEVSGGVVCITHVAEIVVTKDCIGSSSSGAGGGKIYFEMKDSSHLFRC